MIVWKSDEKLLIFASLISLQKSFCLRSNIKHTTHYYITRWKTSKFVKTTPLRVVFSILFSVFHLVIKHCVSYLINYLPILYTIMTILRFQKYPLRGPFLKTCFPGVRKRRLLLAGRLKRRKNPDTCGSGLNC